MPTNLTPSGADFQANPQLKTVGARQNNDSAGDKEARTGCADDGRGHYDPCECPRTSRRRLVTLDRPIRFCGGFGAPVAQAGTDIFGRVERALTILSGPGELDAHIKEVGGLLFPSLRDNRERDRRAYRFLLFALLSGATSEGGTA